MKEETKLIEAGRDPEEQYYAVNPPVIHASTMIYKTAEELFAATGDTARYGRLGTPTSAALQDAIAEIEGGAHCLVTQSGLAAITTTLLSFLSVGDHLLMVDTAYEPTRGFCNHTLRKFGVEVTYYHPTVGAAISELIQPNTKVVFVEAPGSRTFEMQDIPAISKAAKSINDEIVIVMDNTWASPLYFKPFGKGVDASIQAATKYVVGHSDAMLGTITMNEENWRRVKNTHRSLGQCAAPDDVYLGLRGLRTLGVRLKQHWENALTLCTWLKEQPEVEKIAYPALEDDPGYEIWKRDFSGASGLFAFSLYKEFDGTQNDFLNAFHHFSMGYSWGGYESLIVPNHNITRTASKWPFPGPAYRIHAGLENPADLLTDLENAFKVLRGK